MPKSKKSGVASKLRGIKPSHRSMVWKGPEKDGITQSLISRYLVCKERFRLLVVDGLKPAEQFNQRLEYGNLWHTCEEALAGNRDWQLALKLYASTLCAKYKFQQEQVVHWYNVCKVQFEEYVKFWAEHEDVKDRTPIFQEETFGVPYTLPSGRVVLLRGKWDAVDVIGKGRDAGIYIQEDKSKGDINEQKLKTQLTFDLQTMTYFIALEEGLDSPMWGVPIRGVRYNVVRRPLSGGKGSIRQHKPTKSNPQGESAEEFYERLRRDYIAAEPEYWFMRWRVEILPGDVVKFKEQCLHPILENLYDDYEWFGYCHRVHGDVWGYKHRAKKFPHHQQRHFRWPYGVYNPLLEGNTSDLDEYLNTGSETGLSRVDNLFPELT